MFDLSLTEGLHYPIVPSMPEEYFPEKPEVIKNVKQPKSKDILPYPRLG